jgi:hypothetical protein
MTAKLKVLLALAAFFAPLAGCAKEPSAAPHLSPQEVAALRAKLLGEQPASGAAPDAGGAKNPADQ